MAHSTQASAFVKKLAANDRPTREAALESLRQYLSRSKTYSLLELEKLWKGLFYSMWFSDRPRPQQRLAEALGELFSATIPLKGFLQFLEAFYVIIIKEWPNIDQWRMDKFYMLIRRVVMHTFKRLSQEEWDEKLVEQYVELLSRVPLSGDKAVPNGITYHLSDIYLDELEKVMFDQEDEEEDEEKLIEKKKEIAKSVPIQTLITPFETLSKEAPLKTLREKTRSEVVWEPRLIEWGIKEARKSKKVRRAEEKAAREAKEAEEGGEEGEEEEVEEAEEEDEDEDVEDESDDEWTGFA